MYTSKCLVGFETLLMKLERGRVVVLRCAGSYFSPFRLWGGGGVYNIRQGGAYVYNVHTLYCPYS
jgi:hypothetical protein